MGEPIRLVMTVKAYPTASVKYGEAVCAAGIRTDTSTPEWVRLYPVDFRDRPIDQQFPKWDEIEVVVGPSSDSRPESRKPDTTTIKSLRHLSTEHAWTARRPLVEPILMESMCEVAARQRESRASLGAFRPAMVHDVTVEEEPDDWTEPQLNALSRLSLFAQDKKLLEKIPWRWRYRYDCGGGCPGHHQTIIDWEIAEAWRSWRRKVGPEAAVAQIRDKWLNTLCHPSRDTVFFVGNQRAHPEGFLVLGVYWPPKKPLQDVEHLQLGV